MRVVGSETEKVKVTFEFMPRDITVDYTFKEQMESVRCC